METTITVKDQLLDGVAFDDALHVEFEIRPATVEDQLCAIEDVAAESTDQDVDSGVHEARIRLAMLVRQILSLGTIPRENISYAWLRNRLSPDDFDILYKKSEEARKKLRALPKAGATS